MEYMVIAVLALYIFSLRSSLSDTCKELNEIKQACADAQKVRYQAECFYKEKMKESEKINKDIQSRLKDAARKEKLVEAFLKTKIKDFPTVSYVLTDYFTAKDIASSYYLEHKPRPAFKAANEVRAIRQEKRQLIAENKAYKWELAYLRQLLPWLDELEEQPIEQTLDVYNKNNQYDDDAGYWLTPQEYAQLSDVEKYQLALDRYKKRKKSKLEIGLEYERYIGYGLEKKGFHVIYNGINEGFNDRGIDLIAIKGRLHYVIQCKCWSKHHEIREKYINQHIGTSIKYYLDNTSDSNATIANYAKQDFTNDDFLVVPLFYTTTPLNDVAKEFAEKLGVIILEKPMGEYPLIKCNINRSTGEHIYHLPFDQQYNSCLIRDDGEFYAWTVAEAEDAGFRRAFRWHGNNSTH